MPFDQLTLFRPVKVYLCFLLALPLACQSPDANQQSHKAGHPAAYVKTRIEAEPPLWIPALASTTGPLTAETFRQITEKRRALLARLEQLSPIPIPDNAGAISPEAAHQRYVAFIASHASDTILPLFQQRYARVLLNDYRWLETGRADVIAYYTDQLLVARSTDLKTITAGLVVLQGKLPAIRWADLRARAVSLAEERLATDVHQLSELDYWKRKAAEKVGSDAQTNKRYTQWLAFREQEWLKLKKACGQDSLSVALLRGLPTG